jgi:hypothetical protein
VAKLSDDVRALPLALVVLALALALPECAAAHVVVLPAKPQLDTEQEFVVRVPDEEDQSTTAVRVMFPSGVNVSQFAPIAGWHRKVLLTRDKRPRGVVWSGGAIAPGTYRDFRFLATPRRAGTVVWPTFQAYRSGAVKPWTGPPEKPGVEAPETGITQEGPAPATEFTAVPDVASAAPGNTREVSSSSAGIWLGLIAIVIALGSALAVGFLWSTRPARLPPDEPGEFG